MATNKWQITLVITEHGYPPKRDVNGFIEEIKTKWLPPSIELELNEIKVGLIEAKP